MGIPGTRPKASGFFAWVRIVRPTALDCKASHRSCGRSYPSELVFSMRASVRRTALVKSCPRLPLKDRWASCPLFR
jgi:hypothetical protein